MKKPTSRSSWLVVAPSGQTSGLALVRPQDVGQPAGQGGISGISLVTDDIGQTYEALTAKGVSFTGPPQQMPLGGAGHLVLRPSRQRFIPDRRPIEGR
jgi:hypothetical protein